MHRPIFALTALLMGASAATAADMRMPAKAPPPLMAPANLWSGFYLGANLGGGWANANMDFNLDGSPVFASVDNSLSGIAGGVQAGFNWQSGPTVIGIEADYQWTGMKGTLEAPCPPGICAGLAASFTQKMPWFGTVRGRLGYADGGWMIYVTGGYAYARLESEASATAGGGSASISHDDNRRGWTAGGGIEVALSRNWSAKVEYLHLDFGSRDDSYVITGLPTLNASTQLRSEIVRGGVNYRF